MEVLIILLIVLNFMLGAALFVAKMAELDRKYAKAVRDEQEYKSHFRNDRW